MDNLYLTKLCREAEREAERLEVAANRAHTYFMQLSEVLKEKLTEAERKELEVETF